MILESPHGIVPIKDPLHTSIPLPPKRMPGIGIVRPSPHVQEAPAGGAREAEFRMDPRMNHEDLPTLRVGNA